MGCSSLSVGRSHIIWTCSSIPVRMCRIALLLTLFSINIHVSSQRIPKLRECRPEHKAKGLKEYYVPIENNDVSCGFNVTFPIDDGEVVNVIDIRNCENYFRCTKNSCDHCPCGDGETFNPVTRRCDTSNAPCECVGTTTQPTTTVRTTTKPPAPETTTKKKVLVDAGVGMGQGSGDNSNDKDESPVSSEVIIIAAIVSATVIVIVVIVMAVFCWQRRQGQPAVRVKNKPVPPKLSSHTATHDGYSSSIPPSEKHVYAEIDERMVNQGNKHWQHGGSLRAPPLPDHQPPNSPAFTGTCPHHHQHNRTDSGVGSTDTSFTANYHRRTFQPIHPPHSIPIGVAYNERTGDSHCCGDDLYHGREDSSVSADSQYSHSSNPTSLDSHDVDMKTPLHSHPAKQNYISKQVYI